ncbi:signal peptidase I [bacterium]|nr:signal peptidase I [bacterium]
MLKRLISNYHRFRQRQSPSGGLITDLILVIVFLTLMRNLVVESSFVLSDSMEPTLKPGDWLLVDKLCYLGTEPEHGDIVVFNAPLEPGDSYVKRVAAVPGDTVEIVGCRLILNGVLTDEPYLSPDSYLKTAGDGGKNPFAEPIVIPEGRYLVLGDNRPSSRDSRSWGLLAEEEIIGRAELVYFSYSLTEDSARVRWDRMNLSLE